MVNACVMAVFSFCLVTTPVDWLDLAVYCARYRNDIAICNMPIRIFSALTAAVYREFPAYPPYAGQFGVVQPHLTLDAVGAGVTEAVVRGWVADLLPLRVRADRLHVSWYEAGRCQTLAAFPFGR